MNIQLRESHKSVHSVTAGRRLGVMGRSPSASRATLVGLAGIGFLADLPVATRTQLVKRARLLDLPAGFYVMRGAADFGGVVVTGLLRVFAADDSGGREVTYRNVGVGDTVGVAALLGMTDDVWIQALVPSSVLAFDLPAVRAVVRRDPAVSAALAREAMRRVQDTSQELLIWVRGSVRQRVARELLDLASGSSSTTPLNVRISHEALAEAIGSRREVVTRVLGDLAHRGVVRLGRGRVEIVDAVALRSELHKHRSTASSPQ